MIGFHNLGLETHQELTANEVVIRTPFTKKTLQLIIGRLGNTLKGSHADAAQTKPEYTVCEIIVNDAESNTYMPLLVSIWSQHAPDFQSDADEVHTAIKRVLNATNERGLICVESKTLPNVVATDLSILIDLMLDPDIRFVAEAMDQPLVYRQKLVAMDDLLNQCDTPFGGTVYKLIEDQYQKSESFRGDPVTDTSIFIHFGSVQVKLTDSPHPLSLVALKHPTGVPVGILTSSTKLRSRQANINPIASFLSIADIAESLANHKQQYNPSDFRVLTYDRLRLLMALLNAVVFYESQSGLVANQKVLLQPHEGDIARDFLLPEDVAGA